MRRLPTITPAVSAIIKRGAWGLPDQAFTSLSNFITTILLARALSPDQFGEFAVAFSFITVAMALGSAALTQPFVVLSARFEKPQYRRFLSSTLLAQFIFIVVLAIPIAVASAVAAGLGWRLAGLMAITIPAVGAWQIQEFVRQVFYTESRLRSAFLNDVISYGGQVAGFVIAFAAGSLTAVSGLAILALTSTIAIVEGLWLLRHSFDWSLSRQEFLAHMGEAWDFGRWTVAHAVIGSLSGFVMMFMLAGLSGAAAAGVLRAFVTTTAPMRVLIAGTKTSFGPSAAQVEQHEGAAGLRTYIRHIFLLVGPVIGAYSLFLIVFARPVLDLLYGDTFDEYAGLMPLFIASYFAVEAFFAIDIGLRARRATDVLFRASLVAVIGTWLFGPPLIYAFDLKGLLWLNLALAPVYGTVLWFRYQRELRDAPREKARPAAAESEGRAAYDAT